MAYDCKQDFYAEVFFCFGEISSNANVQSVMRDVVPFCQCLLGTPFDQTEPVQPKPLRTCLQRSAFVAGCFFFTLLKLFRHLVSGF